MNSCYSNIEGHQPFLVDQGLYYCKSQGLSAKGNVYWRATFEGELLFNGEELVPNNVVECNPFVTESKDGFKLSLVVSPEGRGYGVLCVEANDPGFTQIRSKVLYGRLPLASFATDRHIHSATRDGSSVVLTKYNRKTKEVEHKRFHLSAPDKYHVARYTRSSMNKYQLILTFVDPNNTEDVFTYLVDTKSNTFQLVGDQVYKCTVYHNRLIHAKKLDDFESRELVEEKLKLGPEAIYTKDEVYDTPSSHLFDNVTKIDL